MLTNLYMQSNNLTRLVNIETLNLFRLSLNNNELVTLTSDMFKMMSLHRLDIRSNRLQPGELETIVTRFRETKPKLKLHYKPQQYSTEKSL